MSHPAPVRRRRRSTWSSPRTTRSCACRRRSSACTPSSRRSRCATRSSSSTTARRTRRCEVVEAAMATIPNLVLVRQRPNRGKGAAVRRGMLAARGQIRVMCDADCSMPPEELPRLLAPIVACKAEIAIGSRYAEGAKTDVKQPLYRVLWSRLCNKVIQRSLVPGVRDTQCGFKAFTAGRRAEPVRQRDDRRLGVRPRDPRARPPPRLRDRRGRRRVEGRRPLARQSAQGHVEGDPRGADDPPQPRTAASTGRRSRASVRPFAEAGPAGHPIARGPQVKPRQIAAWRTSGKVQVFARLRRARVRCVAGGGTAVGPRRVGVTGEAGRTLSVGCAGVAEEPGARRRPIRSARAARGGLGRQAAPAVGEDIGVADWGELHGRRGAEGWARTVGHRLGGRQATAVGPMAAQWLHSG